MLTLPVGDQLHCIQMLQWLVRLSLGNLGLEMEVLGLWLAHGWPVLGPWLARGWPIRGRGQAVVCNICVAAAYILL